MNHFSISISQCSHHGGETRSCCEGLVHLFGQQATRRVPRSRHTTPSKDLEIGEGGALREGGAPNLWGRDYIGLIAQYAAVGFIYGTLPGTIYPFLMNYLNMEGTQTVSARQLVSIPWSFKVFYGIASDCFPIAGYRRRPYMILGWWICFLMLLIMAFSPVGDPYFPSPEVREMKPEDNTPEIESQINYSAHDIGGKYIVLMMLASVGYVCADVAADGVLVEIAQREPEATRGRSQTTIYMVRTVFVIASQLLTAFAFNGEDYGGSFSFSISFPMLMLILAIFLAPVLPISWFFIKEEKWLGDSFKSYVSELFELLQTRALYQVIAYKFCSGVFENFTYVAQDPIASHWAKVEPFTDRMFTILGNFCFLTTMWATGKYGLNWNWRVMQATTVILTVAFDSVCTMLTTWDVVRSQWFWLGVPIIEMIPYGVGFIISTYVVVELAGEGNEGAIYGLVSTVSNLSQPFATTIAKNVNSRFKVENQDIQADTTEVRTDVTITILLMYAMKLTSLLCLPLLPPQKVQTQELKRNGGKSKAMGIFTVGYVAFALCWSVANNILSIFPSTKCMHIAGGRGCN